MDATEKLAQSHYLNIYSDWDNDREFDLDRIARKFCLVFCMQTVERLLHNLMF
jgi:hypothetical protein